VRLIKTLKSLRDSGNTVIVVEHDEDTILSADYLVDFGPGAGSAGGQVVYQGTPQGFLETTHSITADFVSGRQEVVIPKKRRTVNKEKQLLIKNAHANNLKNLDVAFPLEVMIAVVGVSGSGKSTLITDILTPILEHALNEAAPRKVEVGSFSGTEHLKKVIAIDQSPIGRTPRSTPSTYIKLFDDIRNLFSELPESKILGYQPGRFSFNTAEGTCQKCNGFGMVEVDMDFLDDAWVPCPSCYGQRYESSTLTITYKGKNIHDVLEMSVDEALAFFEDIPNIKKKLDTLQKVGLGYMKLGQSSTTLSGGEAQRIKLAKELTRPSKGGVFYILDEPTTGLHIRDVKLLLTLLHEFVNKGNTVLVIEHNMEVVKTADWVIELGPEGGKGGGYLIAEGTPESVAKKGTPTGLALIPVLNNTHEKRQEVLKHATGDAGTYGQVHSEIVVFKAQQNNLKGVDAAIPRNMITVCTGPSGSGKSSFAFDTIYAEGQRRYSESMSAYARQFIQQMPKPKVERIEGLSPAIAIEQRTHAGNSRSTVGTLTEVYDYLRVFVSQCGIPHSPITGNQLEHLNATILYKKIVVDYPSSRLVISAPFGAVMGSNIANLLLKYRKEGYMRAAVAGKFYELDPLPTFAECDPLVSYEVDLVIDRMKATESNKTRAVLAIEKAAELSEGRVMVRLGEEENAESKVYYLAFSDPETGETFPKIDSHLFAFNTESGMCPGCSGSGVNKGFSMPINNWEEVYALLLELDLEKEVISLVGLSASQISAFRREKGKDSEGAKRLQQFLHGPMKIESKDKDVSYTFRGLFPTLAILARHGTEETQKILEPYTKESPCSLCRGSRINPLASAVKMGDYGMADLVQMPTEKLKEVIASQKLSKELKVHLEEVQKEIVSRLGFMCEIGLGYLSLNRTSPSLSGGEAQRIRLARQLGSGVTGVLYVLDEPTIGLHPRDNERLNKALNQLKELGNTLLLVEHDPLTIKQADYIFDFGPQAGAHGGEIVAKGTYEEILQDKHSLTGAYLSGREQISRITEPKTFDATRDRTIDLIDVTYNNLKEVSVSIPLNALVCITGVSGSGKSSLIGDFLAKEVVEFFKKRSHERQGCTSITTERGTIQGVQHIQNVVYFDQTPMGTTSRSDVGSYSEIFPILRDLYVETANKDPKFRSYYYASEFSANSNSGACPDCNGMGYKTINLQFLPEVTIECPSCHGFRLTGSSLQVKYEGVHFGELFHMTVEEALVLFKAVPKVVKILESLIEVGLGYLKLGQEIATLSGGEAQRLRLSTELISKKKNTLYILDEPTTGLHFQDVAKLLLIFERLVEKGHTLLLVEHHCDLIKNADYMIELGPKAGEKGGKLIYSGAPYKAISSKTSITGKYLVD
jgi:excinuclease ABC subunit A